MGEERKTPVLSELWSGVSLQAMRSTCPSRSDGGHQHSRNLIPPKGTIFNEQNENCTERTHDLCHFLFCNCRHRTYFKSRYRQQSFPLRHSRFHTALSENIPTQPMARGEYG